MPEQQPKPSRRSFFFGTVATGAAAAAVVALPGLGSKLVAEPAVQEARPVPEKGGGYSLSEHVKHYYKTTRI